MLVSDVSLPERIRLFAGAAVRRGLVEPEALALRIDVTPGDLAVLLAAEDELAPEAAQRLVEALSIRFEELFTPGEIALLAESDN